MTANTTRHDNDRLAALLDAQGVRIDWVAEQIGVDPSYITKIKNGDRPLTEELATKLARLFRVPVSYFMETVSEERVA